MAKVGWRAAVIVKVLAGLLLISLGVIGWQRIEVSHYKSQVASITTKHAVDAQYVAEMVTKASEAARAAEQTQAAAFDAIARQHEQDKADAQAEADRVAADLRAGRLRLQDRWATQCLATEVAARAGTADEGRADREASAGRIVQAARDADNQIRGLQAVLMAERQ